MAGSDQHVLAGMVAVCKTFCSTSTQAMSPAIFNLTASVWLWFESGATDESGPIIGYGANSGKPTFCAKAIKSLGIFHNLLADGKEYSGHGRKLLEAGLLEDKANWAQHALSCCPFGADLVDKSWNRKLDNNGNSTC